MSFIENGFEHSNFSGCILVKTINECGACSATLSTIAVNAKRAMRDFFVELGMELGVGDPELLAGQLQLLLGGVLLSRC
ncbi:MAG: hypothetical protein ACN4GF_06595 [Lentimonas sp.]